MKNNKNLAREYISETFGCRSINKIVSNSTINNSVKFGLLEYGANIIL